MLLLQIRTCEGHDLDFGQGVAPFAPDGLASARGQGGQEVVEGGVALIEPVILLVLAQQQALLAHQGPFGLGREGDIDARRAGALA